MAKKKIVRPGMEGKVRMDVRFDRDVHAGLTKLAADAGVSVNRLVNALGRWAMTAGKVGETRRRTGPQLKTSRILFSQTDGDCEHLFALDFRERIEYGERE